MEKGKLGDINVNMGDGNQVGDIGHKITLHAPIPGPNSIIQNGVVVGEMVSQPIEEGSLIRFEQLFFNGSFKRDEPFTIQNVALQIIESGNTGMEVFGGRTEKITIWDVVCKVL
ncbi:hypothetical protein [Oryzifoliimicrobium ureilyticus]|uniref:hypothetical protein n=1 Tax=Oryzifoliimicrobium ureilyticus TaxID=3113724 RepID=UPI0030760F15